MGEFTAVVRVAGGVIDGLGVLVIVVGLVLASARFARRAWAGERVTRPAAATTRRLPQTS